jgi:hypothetical protein
VETLTALYKALKTTFYLCLIIPLDHGIIKGLFYYLLKAIKGRGSYLQMHF